MLVVCRGPGCGVTFEAARKTAKYHSDTCRQRARRHPDQVGSGGPVVPAKRNARTRLVDATRAELTAQGRQDTPAGILAEYLAEEIDAGPETGAAMASLSKEYSAAMIRATEDGPAEDPVKGRQQRVARELRVMRGDGRAG
jgi:hypothetical protein